MTTETRRIFHITAGDQDWIPTKKELDDICQAFKEAVFDSPGKDGVVITRHSVFVRELNIATDATFVASKVSED